MNLVSLIGTLVADPTLRHTASGKAVANFNLEVARNGKTADTFAVIAWEKHAQAISSFLTKGRLVGVSGKLQTITQEENTQVVVVVKEIKFLDPKPTAKVDEPAEVDVDALEDEFVASLPY